MEFFNQLHKILTTSTPQEKIALFNTFYEEFKDSNIEYNHNQTSEIFEEASYSSFCSVVPARDVPKRTKLTSITGQITLLHAIAHIEYSAIDLALDAAYRFKNLPLEFYADWLEVAEDEIRHFLMIESLLNDLHAKYGDLNVHDSLFEASTNTQTLLERMAVIPRYFEANGLDSTPAILKKLENNSEEFIKKIVSVLKIILHEEIDHVKKGDRWFEYSCRKDSLSKDIYFDIISKYYPRGFPAKKGLNVNARLEAGFSCKEISKIADKELC